MITITAADLEAMAKELLATRIAALLPPERLETLITGAVERQAGLMSFAAARELFGCSSNGSLRAFCRKYGIQVVAFGQKRQFIATDSIAAAAARRAAVPAEPSACRGTVLANFRRKARA